MDTHGIYEFRVRSYECAADERATLATLANYMQEAASLNAEELSFSKTNFDAASLDITWVLARMRIRVARYPRWEEPVKVLTFPSGVRKIVAYRDFEMTGADGSPVATATTEWMVIDLKRRRAVPVPASIESSVNDVRPRVLGDSPFTPRLRFPDGARPCAGVSVVAPRAAIDMNGHVNNVRSIEWLLESSPEGRAIGDFEVAFRGEILVGDAVRSETAECGDGSLLHRLVAADGTERVVARSLAAPASACDIEARG